ncbi:MAG TPA: CDP-alcohol phosphatidyltransferase family protein [Gemmatimonadales bacterium]|nr:CDP-alcohol phosphatidyltransferase family protein [Gemmatimonadales bacterium]
MAIDPRRLTLLPEPLKNFVLGLLDPVADGLIKRGLRPNGITTLSIVVLGASGAAFAIGWLRAGAALLLLSGFFDLLDGKVARRGGMSSNFGAFYDSTMDRLGEGLLFTGIGIFYIRSVMAQAPGERLPVLGLGLCFAALMGAFLVSYARARAEGLGLECKVGMAQRAERIVYLAVPTIIWGAGPGGWLLLGILSWLTLVSWITVVQRIAHVYRITEGAAAPRQAAARTTPKGN